VLSLSIAPPIGLDEPFVQKTFVAFGGSATRSVIGQNVWLAFGLSVVLILLAARGVLDPLSGALAQSAAVIVVASSARILRREAR
jgi:cation transport ATPase